MCELKHYKNKQRNAEIFLRKEVKQDLSCFTKHRDSLWTSIHYTRFNPDLLIKLLRNLGFRYPFCEPRKQYNKQRHVTYIVSKQKPKLLGGEVRKPCKIPRHACKCRHRLLKHISVSIRRCKLQAAIHHLIRRRQYIIQFIWI